MSSIDRLSQLLLSHSSVVAFTGAGISTESGIPDFRSPGGFWSKHQPVLYDEFLASREARIRYWKLRRQVYEEFTRAEPNDGHLVLARLEQMGKLIAVVTQNIDGLHQQAGSRRVIELHGTARVVACVRCRKEWTPEAAIALIDAGDDAPDCDTCGAPLKSKTISFGQMMPEREMDEAAELAMEADLYLAIGSSLVVEPAASFPRLAKKHGACLVIINHTETPLDPIADLVIRAPIGATLAAVFRKLEAVATTNSAIAKSSHFRSAAGRD